MAKYVTIRQVEFTLNREFTIGSDEHVVGIVYGLSPIAYIARIEKEEN